MHDSLKEILVAATEVLVVTEGFSTELATLSQQGQSQSQ